MPGAPRISSCVGLFYSKRKTPSVYFSIELSTGDRSSKTAGIALSSYKFKPARPHPPCPTTPMSHPLPPAMTTSSSTFTTTQGHTLAYTLFAGASTQLPAIVFVHGLGSSQNYYHAIAQALSSRGHCCLIFDNNGAANSPLTTSSVTGSHLESAQRDTMELIQSVGLTEVVLVGHSMGGMIVNYLASEATREVYPEIEVVKLVLIGPLHPFEVSIDVFSKRVEELKGKDTSIYEFATGIANNAVGSKCAPLKKAFVRELISRQTFEGYIHNCNIIVSSAKLQKETSMFAGVYSSIDCPVYIICGDEDKSTPWAGCVEEIYKGISEHNSNVMVKTLTGVGHWIAIEDPDTVIQVLSEFV